MPAPTTTDEFLSCLSESRLLDVARLDSYLHAALPAQPGPFADRLVRDGLLTAFQAEQLLQGRFRNFVVGKYRLLEPLGAGGQSKVFLAEHVAMRHKVALKMLPRRKAEDPVRVARFFREARAVAVLNHPNIVRAHDVDTSNDEFHYLVMEYVDGVNLHDLVATRGPLDPARAAHYAAQVAAGLQHVHAAGIIHRDVKPANLLLDLAGVVKILDLGLARAVRDLEKITDKYKDQSILGTADFISPEQTLIGGTLDARSDIYCLGATLYFLLTGRPPFGDDSVTKKLIAHQSRDPEPLRRCRPDVPRELAAIQARMMQKKPEKRYQSAAELLQALAPWAGSPVPPDDLPRPGRPRDAGYVRISRLPAPPPAVRRSRWRLAAATAVGAALAGCAALWFLAGR